MAKYTSESIETLKFPDLIRKNASMYISATDENGRWLICRELLDNALDEFLANRNKIAVLFEQPDGSYWVLDGGSGIPQGTKTFTVNVNGKNVTSKMPTMQAVFSEMHTSGKFRSEAYAVSVGCFTGDTKVCLVDGSTATFDCLYKLWCKERMPIAIDAWNTEKDCAESGFITHVQLSKYTSDLADVYINDEKIRCTIDHPFFVRRLGVIASVQASYLQKGDLLVCNDGVERTVTRLDFIQLKEKVPVYGMTVSNCHTYFVAPGVLVSNSHGVGSKGTNATSDFFDVYTCYKGNWYNIAFEKGILKTPVTKLAKPPKSPNGKLLNRGTAVHFKPDKSIFQGKSEINMRFAHQWAEITTYLNPGFTVVIQDKKGKQTKYFSKLGAVEYVNKILEKLKAEAESKKFEFKSDLADVVVAFSNAEGLNLNGYTNGLINSQGGKHVDTVCSCLVQALKKFARKKDTINAYDVKEGLVGIVNMKLHKAEFSSQDKARLTDDRAGKDFEDLLLPQVEKFFASNKALAIRLCEKATKLSQLRTQFKASKKVVQALNQAKKKGMPAKYAPYDARSKVQDRELLIVEGESASGGLRKKRRPYQALAPLRGKIQNCVFPDTLIKTKEGDRRICDIDSDFIGLGYDENTKSFAWTKMCKPFVTKRVSELVELTFDDGTSILVTGDHLVLTDQGYVKAEDLTESMEIIAS